MDCRIFTQYPRTANYSHQWSDNLCFGKTLEISPKALEVVVSGWFLQHPSNSKFQTGCRLSMVTSDVYITSLGVCSQQSEKKTRWWNFRYSPNSSIESSSTVLVKSELTSEVHQDLFGIQTDSVDFPNAFLYILYINSLNVWWIWRANQVLRNTVTNEVFESSRKIQGTARGIAVSNYHGYVNQSYNNMYQKRNSSVFEEDLLKLKDDTSTKNYASVQQCTRKAELELPSSMYQEEHSGWQSIQNSMLSQMQKGSEH